MFKRSTLAFCVLALLYVGQGVLKSFGEVENRKIAIENREPIVKQLYTTYLGLGAKNLAGKIFPSIK